MIFSISEIREFLRCKLRWDFSSTNRQRLSPIIVKPQLSLGRNIHEGLAGWMVDVDADVIALYMLATAKELAGVEKFYKEKYSREPTDEELSPILDNVKLGRAMLGNYRQRWQTPLPSHLKVIAPEQEVVVDIPGTEHSLKMILDGICQSSNTHNNFIIDHKTYNIKPREETLRYDLQFTAYVWGANRLGLNVEGVAYDGLWKREEPPKNKTLQDLFTRMIIRPGVDELLQFEQTLRMITTEMANKPFIYPNWMNDGSCVWGCMYKDLCIATMRDEDVDYVRARKYITRPPREAEEAQHDAA